MIPQDLKENFTKLEAEVATEKGDFELFALFLREDISDRWDLMISAHGPRQNRKRRWITW